jgi:hypothetical protein
MHKLKEKPECIAIARQSLRAEPPLCNEIVGELLDTHSEVEITAILNERGHRTYRQIPYTLD